MTRILPLASVPWLAMLLTLAIGGALYLLQAHRPDDQGAAVAEASPEPFVSDIVIPGINSFTGRIVFEFNGSQETGSWPGPKEEKTR